MFFLITMSPVTLSASKSGTTYFKGFLIEARDAANLDGGAVGSFTLVNSSESQLLNCGHTQVSNLLMIKTVRFTQANSQNHTATVGHVKLLFFNNNSVLCLA